MSIYLHDIPLPQARERLEEALRSTGLWGLLGVDEIPLEEQALGRVLAEPIWAKISSPHYHAAAMDGFALRSGDTADAMPTAPVTLKYGQQTVYVDTGDPLPGWANAVMPIENVEPLDESGQLSDEARRPHSIRLRTALPPWQHVRPLGEDMVATQLVLPAGHLLRPVDLGAIAACGHDRVRVARRPGVAILPTGSELVEIGEEVRAGDIIEFNSLVLAAQINDWGACAQRFPITPDKFELIRARVLEVASSHDLILLNAGSSAGSEDFSAQVIESLGDVLVHGVAVRPGHPVILGMVKVGGDEEGAEKRQVPIIGVPGYPVSAALTGEIFVRPLVELWLGRQPHQPVTIQATLTRKTTSPPGDDDYVRVAVGRVGEKMLAAPLARGAGVISSLVRADGIAIIPRGSQGLPAGAEITVQLLRAQNDLERTIFAIGSHDISLDILAQFLSLAGRRLASANVGSQGGLVALRRGEAHLAGSHLMDPQTGEYNLSYVREYLPRLPLMVVALVERQQGMIVEPGNPKAVNSINDIVNPAVTFINRQRGAGTRVLLDYHLDKLGIASQDVRGYDQEEYTHLAIAAAIASGRANCGLGIAAAAQALGLDFIPLFEERYDLVIPKIYYESPLLEPLLHILDNPEFRGSVASLPGYNTRMMGQVIADLS